VDPRAEWRDDLVARLADGARVVELGCGTGTEETRVLAQRFRPGGRLMTALGAGDLPDWTGDFPGAQSFFSGRPPDTNRRLLREAGFEIVRDEVVTIREPEGPRQFHWVLTRR
jgi:hypothetical protein